MDCASRTRAPSAASGNPVWSPDGKYLDDKSEVRGSPNLWRVAIDESTGKTGRTEQITNAAQLQAFMWPDQAAINRMTLDSNSGKLSQPTRISMIGLPILTVDRRILVDGRPARVHVRARKESGRRDDDRGRWVRGRDPVAADGRQGRGVLADVLVTGRAILAGNLVQPDGSNRGIAVDSFTSAGAYTAGLAKPRTGEPPDTSPVIRIDRCVKELSRRRENLCRIALPHRAGENHPADHAGQHADRRIERLPRPRREKAAHPLQSPADALRQALASLAAGAGDFGAQSGDRTALLGMGGVLGAEIAVDQGVEAPLGRDGLEELREPLQRPRAGVLEGFAQELVLRCEMGVEAAVGEAGIGHDVLHAHAGDAALAERRRGGLNDALARLFLVLAGPGHQSPFRYMMVIIL
jgi:hypothetical protein